MTEDEVLKIIAVTHWHLYAAIYILDHADLILSADEAKAKSFHVKRVGLCSNLHFHFWETLGASNAQCVCLTSWTAQLQSYPYIG